MSQTPNNVQTIPKLLCVKQVAEDYLRLSENSVYQLLLSGDLRGTRVGKGEKHWRTTDKWVQEYLERTHGAPRKVLPDLLHPAGDSDTCPQDFDELELTKQILAVLNTLAALQEKLRLALEARLANEEVA